MTKFSIAQVSVGSFSGKVATWFLLGAGVLFSVYSLFGPWRQPTRPLITPSAVRTNTPPPRATAPEVVLEREIDQQSAPVRQVVHNEPENNVEQPIVGKQEEARHLFFLVAVKGEDEERFDTWEAAKERLLGLNNIPGDVTLGVEFAPELITDHHDEEYFRKWLARVGDYVFARRILSIASLKQVLQNRELGRVNADEVEERGCALLEKDEKWRVTIQGLEKSSEELIRVGEEIFWRAFQAPASMAQCETLKEKKISEILLGMKYKLSDIEIQISNLFLQACTHNTAMRNANINNLHVFLPLVPFEVIANLPEKEQGYIRGQKDAFFNDYFINVVEKVIRNDISKNIALPTILNKTLLAGESYQWLASRLRNWTRDSDISSSLLRSLFNDPQHQ